MGHLGKILKFCKLLSMPEKEGEERRLGGRARRQAPSVREGSGTSGTGSVLR